MAFNEGDIVPPQQYREVTSCSPMASPSCFRIAASACWRRVLIGLVEREGVDSESESTSISPAAEVWLSQLPLAMEGFVRAQCSKLIWVIKREGRGIRRNSCGPEVGSLFEESQAVEVDSIKRRRKKVASKISSD